MKPIEQLPWLSRRQADAVRAFAIRHGADWKRELRAAWAADDGREGAVLHLMRDSHGEEWLSITNVRLQSMAVH